MRLYLPTLASAAILLSLSVSPAVAAGTTCKASTAQEVGQCINQLNSGSITTIEVTAKINCTVDNKCQYNITTTKGGAIFGTPGSGAGFFRSGDYTKGAFGAPVFKLTGAANVTISNLLFDDNVNDANQPYCIESAGHPCDYNSQLTNPNPVTTAFWNSPLTFQFIYVENSNSITLRELNMTNCKRDSIHAINSNNLVVQNSVINNSFLRGIGLETINGALIEGNYFYINGGAGITGVF